MDFSDLKVGVVVPVRHSHEHIGELVGSLITQTHSNTIIMLVGGKDDLTWSGLPNTDQIICLEVEIPSDHIGRDSNIKRNAGAQKAIAEGCDIITVTDSKISMEPTWLSEGLSLLVNNNVDAVAGIMKKREDDDSLLCNYQDESPIKRAGNFGHVIMTEENSAKLANWPMTCNLFFTVEAYHKAGGFDESFTVSWEDYSFVWQLLHSGCQILSTDQLYVYHKHRSSIRLMIKEYLRSGRATAQFLFRYPTCQFVLKRTAQSLLVLAAIAALVTGLFIWPLETTTLGASGALLLSSVLVVQKRRLEAAAYPLLMVFFTVIYSAALIDGVRKGGLVRESDKWYLQY